MSAPTPQLQLVECQASQARLTVAACVARHQAALAAPRRDVRYADCLACEVGARREAESRTRAGELAAALAEVERQRERAAAAEAEAGQLRAKAAAQRKLIAKLQEELTWERGRNHGLTSALSALRPAKAKAEGART